MAANKKIFGLYKELCKKHGRPEGQWVLWCKRTKIMTEREEVIVGAILTQNTNWKNVSLAISELKKVRAISLKTICALGKKQPAKLKSFIRSSGFYNTKFLYLLSVADFFVKNGGVKGVGNISLKELREKLLAIKGVGPETADSILLYALDKPVFVIDEYTRRFVKKNRIVKNLSYEYLRKLFEDNLPKNFKIYQDFHALIVIDGKTKFS